MFHLVQKEETAVTQLHVEAEGTAEAAPEVVWALVADADSYCRWGPWSASGYDRHGDAAPGGAGAIRWMRYGPTTTVERVLEVENGRRMAYTVVKGIPVRNYRAEVTLTPTAAGTRIRWAASWDRTLGGRIVHRKLRSLYPEIMAHLIAAAASRAEEQRHDQSESAPVRPQRRNAS
jgi:uncharacterized protein YndB with AHSA1/START domain